MRSNGKGVGDVLVICLLGTSLRPIVLVLAFGLADVEGSLQNMMHITEGDVSMPLTA